MTQTQYKKHSGKWFSGKEAILTETIQNNGGGVIEKEDVVIISSKNGRGRFNIRSIKTGISISRVNWRYIELICTPTKAID